MDGRDKHKTTVEPTLCQRAFWHICIIASALFPTFQFRNWSDVARQKNAKEPKFSHRTPDLLSLSTICILMYIFFSTLINIDPP